jgi:DNA-binding IclR family transcriptional regulator
LAVLARRGLVERAERGRYRPGVGLVALGLGVLDREPIVVAARPVLEAQAAALGETFFLVAARAGELVVLEKAEGTGFLRAAPQVGAVVPAHATAVGKLYLAHAPESLEPGVLERFTERTLTVRAELEAEVEAARAQAFAVNRDEWIVGLTVYAAPIWIGERMVGAVALAAPSARADELGPQGLALRVVSTAQRISQRLGGREFEQETA